MVAILNAHGNPKPCGASQNKEDVSITHQTRPGTSITSQVNIVDVPHFRRPFENKGLSEAAVSIISSSWRKSTQRQYKPYIVKWEQYCSSRKLDQLSTTVEDGVNFLAELYQGGSGYSALNTARSALSTTLMISDSETFGSHPLVSRFMKGAFETRPSLPRYGETWDVNVMLNYLSSLGLPAKQTLKMLTYKVVMLLSLLSSQRRQTIHALDISTMQLSLEKCTFMIKSLLKTSRPGKHLTAVEFKSYPLDKHLCPVAHVAEYVNRTKTLRGNQNKLFISFQKPYKEVSPDTIGRWLKTTLALAGIDVTKFGAHSIRSASTSAAKAMNIPIDIIMLNAGWSHLCKILLRTYYKRQLWQHVVAK